ncbi:MAG: hypothetical protein WAT84_04090 [Candidatus Moraniibacteriota bacterium]
MPKLPLVYRIEVVPLTPLYGRRDPRFSYASPTPLPPGSLVSISFGKRTLTGVTLDSTHLPGPVPQWMKYVGVTLLPGWLTADQIALAWHMSERLYAPLGLVLKPFFPIQRKPRMVKSAAGDTVALSVEPARPTRRRKKRVSAALSMEAVQDDAQLFQRLITCGKQALAEHQPLCILVPEVLAAELYAEKLKRALPQANIGCLTSRRTSREQYILFQAIRAGTLDIIIGTRQAVFAPFSNLGSIVIIDSEKRLSFTQWEMTPRYDAIEIAEWIAARHTIACVELSVAPGIEYFAADITPTRLGQPFTFSKRHSLVTIDLRLSFSRHKTPPVITVELMTHIRDARTRGESVLILVKQRGLARFSFCAKCQSPQRCPKCQTMLSEMKDGRFRCLACGYRTSLFPACASCGHMHFRSFGAGTQAIERALQREGIADGVITIDRDATQLKHDFRALVSTLSPAVGPTVIIATYEAASALPLPPLGLIAMIEPDQGLFYPDFQSEERLWRELRRFGAKLCPGGTLAVQTFEPESVFWTTWAHQKLELTARGLLDERRMLRYPPYYHLIQLECYPSRGSTSLDLAYQVETKLRELAIPEVEIVPRYLPFNRKNRYHILIRYLRTSALPEKLRSYLSTLGPDVRITNNPLSLHG